MFAYCNNEPVASTDPTGHYMGHRPIMVNDGADSIVSLLKTAAKYYTKEYAGLANCYAFAFNLKVDPRTGEIFQERPQPGCFSGGYSPYYDGVLENIANKVDPDIKGLGEDVYNTIKRDGAALGFRNISSITSADYSTTEGQWVIAIAFGFDEKRGRTDYHFYKRMESGYWFHKDGASDVLATDSSGSCILDPRLCNRGFYSEFIGYFLVTP